MSEGAAVHPDLGRLAAQSYDHRALELIRFRADPVDDAVAGVVRSVAVGEDDAREGFRAGLDEAGLDTLRLFAMRRVVHARRTSSLAALYESLDAVALLPREGDVPWDSWVRASLFVARDLGGDPGSIQGRFYDVAPEAGARRFDVVLDSMDRVDTLAECRIAEVRTTYGVGWIETLLIHGARARGWYGTSRLADDAVPFGPSSNLAQLAAGLADAVDASGRASAGPIGHDQLAGSLFSLAVPGSYVEAAGCLSFVTEPVGEGDAVTVFLAELADPGDDELFDERYDTSFEPEELVEAARATDDQEAVADGRRIVVLSPQPRFDDGPDEPPDLAALADLARRALTDPATR